MANPTRAQFHLIAAIDEGIPARRHADEFFLRNRKLNRATVVICLANRWLIDDPITGRLAVTSTGLSAIGRDDDIEWDEMIGTLEEDPYPDAPVRFSGHPVEMPEAES